MRTGRPRSAGRFIPALRGSETATGYCPAAAIPPVARRSAPVAGSKLKANVAIAVRAEAAPDGVETESSTSTVSEETSGRMRIASPEARSAAPVTLLRWIDRMTLGGPPSSSCTSVLSMVACPERTTLPAASVAPPLRFGSWAGGDMDGNPHVTPATITDTVRAQRELAFSQRLSGRGFTVERHTSPSDVDADHYEAWENDMAALRRVFGFCRSFPTRFMSEAVPH